MEWNLTVWDSEQGLWHGQYHGRREAWAAFNAALRTLQCEGYALDGIKVVQQGTVWTQRLLRGCDVAKVMLFQTNPQPSGRARVRRSPSRSRICPAA